MMRKPYSLPNYEDPVEYLTRPFYCREASSEKASSPDTQSVSITVAISVVFGDRTQRTTENNFEDRHD